MPSSTETIENPGLNTEQDTLNTKSEPEQDKTLESAEDGVVDADKPIDKDASQNEGKASSEVKAAPKKVDISDLSEGQIEAISTKIYSKMHKTFQTKLGERDTEIERLTAENRKANNAVIELLKGGIEPEPGTAAAKVIDEYRKSLGDSDLQRARAKQSASMSQYVESLKDNVSGALKEAGVDPVSDEVNEVLAPLMAQGNYAAIWPAATRLIAAQAKKAKTDTEGLKKDIRKQVLKEYRLNENDTGSGGGSKSTGDVAFMDAYSKGERNSPADHKRAKTIMDKLMKGES